MRASWLLLGFVGVGFSVFSCGGGEFGSGGPNDADAGQAPMTEGGGDDGSGGSSVTPAEGGSSGSESTGGSGDPAGMPGATGGTTGSAGTSTGTAGGPDPGDCSGMVAPELPGDCQKVVCSQGKLSTEPDSNDVPEPRGVCDVPACEQGQPVFHSDPSKCQINEACSDGQCECAGCPNGVVAALGEQACRLPAGVAVSANLTLQGSAASHLADGNAQTQWNSGAYTGVVTIKPASPQAMTAITVWLVGNAEPNTALDKKYISVSASIETEDGVVVNKSGNFSFAQNSTGALRLDLGLIKAKKITLSFQSPSTWIASHEVVFEVCEP